MAEWIPPKTNWQAGDIPGAEDFNRSEGNTDYLKGQQDGLKDGSVKAGDAAKLGGQLPGYYDTKAYILPSDTVILQSSGRSSQGYDWVPASRFRLKHEGIYRIKLNIRTSEETSTAYASIYVEQGTGVEGGSIVRTTSKYNQPRTQDVYVPAGGVVAISIKNSHTSCYTYVSNISVCGTQSTKDQVPNSAVLQN